MQFHTNLENSFYEYYDNKLTTRNAFDYMQKNLRCCGVDSSNDWKNNTISKEIPESCCVHDTGRECSQYPANIFGQVGINKVLDVLVHFLHYVLKLH